MFILRAISFLALAVVGIQAVPLSAPASGSSDIVARSPAVETLDMRSISIPDVAATTQVIKDLISTHDAEVTPELSRRRLALPEQPTLAAILRAGVDKLQPIITKLNQALKVDVKEGVTVDITVALSLLNDVVVILKDVSVQVQVLVKNPVSTPLRLITSLVNGVEISQLIATLLRLVLVTLPLLSQPLALVDKVLIDNLPTPAQDIIALVLNLVTEILGGALQLVPGLLTILKAVLKPVFALASGVNIDKIHQLGL